MFHEELRAYCCRGNCAFRLSHMSLLKDLMKESEPYEDGDGIFDFSTLLYNAQHYDDWLDELMLGHLYIGGDGVRQSYPRAMK